MHPPATAMKLGSTFGCLHSAEGDLREEPEGPGYYLSEVPGGKGFMCGVQEEGGGACQRWYPPTSVASVLGVTSLTWLVWCEVRPTGY